MAVTLGKTTESNQSAHTKADTPPPPYLGRSVRIVGPVVNVDMNQSPHPKNQRGELGKPLFNWYHNTVSKDPLTRVSAPAAPIGPAKGRTPAVAGVLGVELGGLEPPTSWVRSRRSPN